MLIPSFQLRLGQTVVTGLVCVGKCAAPAPDPCRVLRRTRRVGVAAEDNSGRRAPADPPPAVAGRFQPPPPLLGLPGNGFHTLGRGDAHNRPRFPDDGKHPSLTAATSAGKVFLHTPHDKEAAAKAEGVPLKFLSINRKITALTAGALRPHSSADVLLVGTPTALLAYDVEANSDLFFKEVPDGVNAVIFGHVPGAQGRP